MFANLFEMMMENEIIFRLILVGSVILGLKVLNFILSKVFNFIFEGMNLEKQSNVLVKITNLFLGLFQGLSGVNRRLLIEVMYLFSRIKYTLLIGYILLGTDKLGLISLLTLVYCLVITNIMMVVSEIFINKGKNLMYTKTIICYILLFSSMFFSTDYFVQNTLISLVGTVVFVTFSCVLSAKTGNSKKYSTRYTEKWNGVIKYQKIAKLFL